MMHGVIRVSNEETAKMFSNSPLARNLLGFTKTQYGGQFNNAWLGLPFQFMSWGIASQRKLVTAGIQGRNQSLFMGSLAMIGMGLFSDWAKNPKAWQYRDNEEKMIRAIEQSGVLGLFSDINFITENISAGIFDTPIGLRPALDLPNKFGQADLSTGLGEVVGAGPSIFLDLAYTFGSDSTFNERANAIRRILPLNNLCLWDDAFKAIYRSGVDLIRPEDEE